MWYLVLSRGEWVIMLMLAEENAKDKKTGAYVGVQQVHAVQALAAVNAAFDAPQRGFALAHGQREGGGGGDGHSTGAARSTWRLT